MFEVVRWPVAESGRPPTLRVDAVPVPVRVDLCRGVVSVPDDTMIGRSPLWLHGAGVELFEVVEGERLASFRSTRGSWLSVVDLHLRSGDRQGSLHVTHVCPARWVERLDGLVAPA